MKKIIPTLILLSLILNSLWAIAASQTETQQHKSIEETIQFTMHEPTIQQNQMILNIDNTNAYTNQPNYPIIPYFRKTYILPSTAKLTSITIHLSTPKSLNLDAPIQTKLPPQILTTKNQQEPTLTETKTSEPLPKIYPTSPYTYTHTIGLYENTLTQYITILCYPLQYFTHDNSIQFSDTLTIQLTYSEREPVQSTKQDYDLLIITPQKFQSVLEPLVEHKNTHNMQTTMRTLEDIYDQFTGRDKPEQIKYAIKNDFEEHGIKYVLLVGGLNSYIKAISRDDANQGTLDWHCPVRYTNLYDSGATHDSGCISDLYYADFYKIQENETVFEDWDSNGNGIFAEWVGTNKDIIDMVPEVYIGRLACANRFEVQIMVNKIIDYESSPAADSWFKQMVVIGGDTFDDVGGTNFYEGEVENQKALDYMPEFNGIKIWCSNRDTGGLVPEPKDIIKTVSQGCGFLAFAGHGSPERWNTYWPEAFDEERARGLWWWNIPLLHNGKKLPICVVGGCHNSQFNITATSFIDKNMWTYGPVPQCFSWLLTRKIGGGTIATIGNTGLGFGDVGESGDRDGDGINDPDCVEALGGYIESQFFKAYGTDGKEILGDAWGQAVTQYLSVYPPMNNKLDAKTVQQWVILGDPSLMIGGYS